MIGRALAILALWSLLALGAMLVLQRRAHESSDGLVWDTARSDPLETTLSTTEVFVLPGRVGLWRTVDWIDTGTPGSGWIRGQVPFYASTGWRHRRGDAGDWPELPGPHPRWQVGGLEFYRHGQSGGHLQMVLLVPTWPILTLLCVLPLAWLMRRKRRSAGRATWRARLAILSLLLVAGIVGLWARTHRLRDLLEIPLPDSRWAIETSPGRLTLCRYRHDVAVNTWTWERTNTLDPRSQVARSGRVSSGAAPAVAFSVPLWGIVLIGLVCPARWLGQRLAAWREDRRRHRQGLCFACGYDLRASIGRCPECGTVIPPAQAAPHGRSAAS